MPSGPGDFFIALFLSFSAISAWVQHLLNRTSSAMFSNNDRYFWNVYAYHLLPRCNWNRHLFITVEVAVILLMCHQQLKFQTVHHVLFFVAIQHVRRYLRSSHYLSQLILFFQKGTSNCNRSTCSLGSLTTIHKVRLIYPKRFPKSYQSNWF